MRFIKYFFEEPSLLDFSSPDSESSRGKGEPPARLHQDKRHYRGYLAATDLEQETVGGSSLLDNAAANALAEVLNGPVWMLYQTPNPTGNVDFQLLHKREQIARTLVTMPEESFLVANLVPQAGDVARLIGNQDKEETLPGIVRLVDMGATVVFPEPAHVGHDWSIYSGRPLSTMFKQALSESPDDCRCFVIPYAKARGEHKFYFEQYDPELFAEFEIR